MYKLLVKKCDSRKVIQNEIARGHVKALQKQNMNDAVKYFSQDGCNIKKPIFIDTLVENQLSFAGSSRERFSFRKYSWMILLQK